jgi:predicted metalloendopeptidase
MCLGWQPCAYVRPAPYRHPRTARWWSPEDIAAFKKRTEALADQYSSFEPLKGMHVNGVVRNVDARYGAFDVKPGAKLYLPPDQRVHIW